MGKYLFKILIALDQLGAAICGLNEDCTISATTGYYNTFLKPGRYWSFMRWMIDSTFYAIEGSGHCKKAYHKDSNEEFIEGFKWFLMPFTMIFCIILSIIFYTVFFIKKGINFITAEGKN